MANEITMDCGAIWNTGIGSIDMNADSCAYRVHDHRIECIALVRPR